jgi:hypothetical protein
MINTKKYVFDLPKGGDIVDFIQANKMCPKVWNGLDGLSKYSKKNGVRKRLRKVINDHAEDIPAEWEENDVWLHPDMGIATAEAHTPPSLPYHVFGDFWSEAVKWNAAACSAPEDYIALCLLVVAAGVIGNTRRGSPNENWSETTTLWGAIVGEPGASKTQAMNAVLQYVYPIQRRYDQEYKEVLEVWKQEEAQYKQSLSNKKNGNDDDDEMCEELPPKPIHKRLIVNDITTEGAALRMKQNPRGLTSVRDELAGFIGGIGRYSGKPDSDRSFWLEANNGGVYAVDRASAPDEPTLIAHLSLSVLGGTQPDKLRSILLSGDNDGLAARFFMVWPQHKVFTYKKDRFEGHKQALAGFDRLAGLEMLRTSDDTISPLSVPLHPKAAKMFYKWVRKFEKSIVHRTGMLKGHLAKYRGMSVRIALVLELLWWSVKPKREEPHKISAKAINAAIELLETYFMPMAIRCYADASIPPAQRNSASLARWIMKNKPSIVNARNLYRHEDIDGLNNAAAVKEAIPLLVEAGWLRPKPSREGGGYGRPRSDFEVNPRLFN